MSSARDIIGSKRATSWRAWLGGAFGLGREYALMGWMLARHVSWFAITVGMITAVPLIFEVSSVIRTLQLEGMKHFE